MDYETYDMEAEAIAYQQGRKPPTKEIEMYTLKIGKFLTQDFFTIKDASNAYQDLRDELGLGASEFNSGKLREKASGKQYKISYNGRVWDLSNNEVAL